MTDIYANGTYAVQNAIECLQAIRNAVDAGHVTLVPGGEQRGNYADVCGAVNWLQNHPQITTPVVPTVKQIPTNPDGSPLDVVNFVRVVNWPGSEFKTLETWTGHEWRSTTIGEKRRWLNVRDLVIDVEANAVIVGREARFAASVTRDNNTGGVVEPFDETQDGGICTLGHDFPTNGTKCVRCGIPRPPQIPESAFRIVPTPTGYAVDLFLDGQWSKVAGWPNWSTEGEAEAEILSYGMRTGIHVTLVRKDGAEIVTAAPGYAFPRQIDVREPVLVDILEGMTPEHEGTLSIRPDLVDPARKWNVYKWYGHEGRVTGWLPTRDFEPYDTYWEAVERVTDAAARSDAPIYLTKPTPSQLAQWAAHGFTIDRPPVTPWEAAPGAFDGLPTGTILAELATGAGEALGVRGSYAVTPAIGTKVISSLDLAGSYAVDEWTLTGWNRITQDPMSWEDAAAFIRPAVPESARPVGTCEIRPGTEPNDLYNVVTWTGREWKQIAGNVTRRTAEGVVRARAMDRENPMPPITAAPELKADLEIILKITEKWAVSSDVFKKINELAKSAIKRY